jgi:hypothetical protein
MKLDEVLEKNMNGLHYGNRVLLPFACDLLKAVVENDIITDFSHLNRGAYYLKKGDRTEIYFHDYPSLIDVISKYEKIKLIVVEEGEDLFDFDKHRKIALDIKGKHILTIEELDDDILFIE